ncbi:MAG: hypothetical protein GC182_12460 [Rhodopseudomonas sp.]|nr:hypothetical protein [Rhodopseudomonas sp.]
MTVAGTSSPEFVLTVACCRWPPSETRDHAVREAAAGPIDWDRLLRVVRRHRVDGLVHAALTAAGIEPPPAAATVLARRAHAIARHDLTLAAETARLQGLFDAAGIAVLVLKGIPLALLAYRSLGLKHSKDIDLLVPPERAMQAWELLEAQGYGLRQPRGSLSARQRRLVLRYAREIALADQNRGSEVELRWRAATSPPLLTGVDAYREYQTVTLSNGAGIRTLNDDDLFAYLCLHGADHGWSRLKWLADLNAFLAGKDDAEVRRLVRHAEAIGASVCAALALTLRHRLFGIAPPADGGAVPRAGARLRVLTALATDIMVGPAAEIELEDRRFGTTRVAMIRFLLGGGWANVMALGRDLSIRLDDVLRLPLPDALHFLYPALRLPLWLWRRFIGAGRRSKA